VAQTGRPMRKQHATATPDKAIQNPERVNAIDVAKIPQFTSRQVKPARG
jgi:hypothetical protein